MPKAPRRPPQLRGRIFRGSTAVSRGLLTRNELRSSAWRPLFRDVYADAQITVTHTDSAPPWTLAGPTRCAIAGRSAAALYGARSLSDEPVDVLVPAATRIGPTAGMRVHHGEVDSGDIVTGPGSR